MNLSKETANTGFRTARTIMQKWGVPAAVQSRILRVSRQSLAKADKGVRLDRDQLTRISLILNIHAALRLQFSNPDNTYGFMGMQNNNEFFNGRSPLEVIESGDIIALYETFKHLQAVSDDWMTPETHAAITKYNSRLDEQGAFSDGLRSF
ncbi:antitoxin Xre-like helix-turn-helix domain-containing protein [Halopseudomonas sp.]|jgi:hypothetical protein|uniref:antitoxin Xre-like helix-turn-helix domain-containing protein n=1 Tax=Halopseudomonas sp. TaxID=2901191 RepID=UPI003FA57526|tara:strand:+ start:74 stop:526 length:453 start_codon:yes stop_codon:yes gene_type:complete